MGFWRQFLVPIAIVGIWGTFSATYLGVEDGSSGLSLLGWVHVGFFLPGLGAMDLLEGSHSNDDIPLMIAISFVVWTLAFAFIGWVIRRRRTGAKA